MGFILETKNLVKKFGGVPAIHNLSLKIEKGAITVLIGPNGSGKTTFVNCLSGLLSFDSGEFEINGAVLKNLKSHEAVFYGFCRTFQETRLFSQINVLENLLLVLTERNVWAALFEKHSEHHLEEAEKILKRFGLWQKRNRLGAELSYGERKLLETARAIAVNADLYLLDEPFAGLFPEKVKTVSAIIEEMKREGKTIVLIEHNIGLIRAISDYVIVLDSGELLAQGRPEDVLKKKEVLEAYLGE